MALSGPTEVAAALSAFGGKADLHGRVAFVASVAIDPTETLAAKFCCDAQPASPANVITSARPNCRERAEPHEAAEIHYTSRRRGGVAARSARATG
jgi:hypothetical protein